MKYAHIERERRYLPLGNMALVSPIRNLFIQDRYLDGSTLRLRRIEEDGKSTVFKLGQKIREGEEIPLMLVHTTMYLTESEFELVAVLPARLLSKRRSIFPLGELNFAVDKFEGELDGLVLAEVDLGVEGSTHDALPFEELLEVTADDRFTGGTLASTSTKGLRSLLNEYGVD